MENTVVIGMDGGGTHTRVMVSDLQGQILSYVEHGGSSIRKDNQAKENARQAIIHALESAGCAPQQVKGLCAGVAGLDSEEDLAWVEGLTDVPGLNCPKWHVNDAVIAHAGAFLEKPGIVVVSGTGSILFAITEDGTHLRNYDFGHYASSAARFLSYDAVYELLAGNRQQSDEAMAQQILKFWAVNRIDELHKLASGGFMEDRKERDKKFGQMAPIVTKAAQEGSPLARTVCDRAVQQIVVGVELLGACFRESPVTVTGIGSVIQSPYMKAALTERLKEGNNKFYAVVEPALSAVSGAVIMALKRLQAPVDEQTLRNLLKHPQSQYQVLVG
ncbi:N-acetylglucosamine kinase [Paenibacillus sp. J2TS4]|uniref:N-acetylglucosamine kinase n=1 Tax=Paenibacillus sp. J2TS4 TaxID=2807194 RepID=UPI001BCC207E|nr:BadF/BadG/BcrA/BcrD ATPase family protein [Paenibacillus sp. J2TS4]